MTTKECINYIIDIMSDTNSLKEFNHYIDNRSNRFCNFLIARDGNKTAQELGLATAVTGFAVCFFGTERDYRELWEGDYIYLLIDVSGKIKYFNNEEV